MRTKISLSRILLVTSAIALMLAMSYPANVALAASPYQIPAQGGEQLGIWFMREKNALSAQQTHVKEAQDVEQKTQTAINKLTSEGKDASWLSSALASFTQGVSTAESYNNQAAGILNTAAGFDGSGNVTDARQALTTIRQAGHYLREAHLAITQATLDFRAAISSHLK
jgi:hypothetical protein